jgi:hypothetical protein
MEPEQDEYEDMTSFLWDLGADGSNLGEVVDLDFILACEM